MFARIILTAVFAGLLAGAFAWGAHMVKTTPLILAAEVYENAAPAA
ncbi:MAG: CbtA family protein, partial [Rhodospirillales bacterium]|nr:CbtA family protein [Rhodospirillales bacterium]